MSEIEELNNYLSDLVEAAAPKDSDIVGDGEGDLES